jgi:hypothetical protein
MDDTEKFNDSLKGLVGDLDNTSGAAQELVKILQSLNKASKEELAAKEKEAVLQKKIKDRQDKVDQGMQSMTASMIGVIAGLNAVTSSIYGSDKAFTSLVPTLDLYAKTTKDVLSAMGDLGSGVSILGFSTGKVSEGMAKVAGIGVDIVANIAKFQLETAQKLADNYVEMSKAGATFGGSINRMAQSAADAQLPIDIFGKLIKTNADGLSRMGLGVEKGAVVIGQMSNNIAKTNPRLLATYGSYENLNNAIAEYASLQTQVAAGELKDRKALEQGAMKYLDQQRELTALTGLSAEQLKKEQEERQKDAAYQLALNKMTADERLNSEYALTQISAKYGAEAAQYAKEYISTGGQVFSQAGLKFQAMAGPVADTVGKMVTGLNQNTDAFRSNANSIMTQDAARNMEFAKSNEFFAKMTQAGYENDITKMLTNVSGAIVRGNESAANAAQAHADILNDKAKGIGAASQNFIDATNALAANQKQIDSMVVKNMSGMSKLIDFLYGQQKDILNMQDKVVDVINALAEKDFAKFQTALGKLTEAILEKTGILSAGAPGSTAAATKAALNVQDVANVAGPDLASQRAAAAARHNAWQASNDSIADEARRYREQKKAEREASDNQRAGEGIAYGPTMTGEDGPEAHIKLRNNSIPLDINLNPLLEAMREQSVLQQEVIRELRDSRDVQEKILNASY